MCNGIKTLSIKLSLYNSICVMDPWFLCPWPFTQYLIIKTLKNKRKANKKIPVLMEYIF